MSPLQNQQFHQTYGQVMRAHHEKMRELIGEDPRVRQLRAARPIRLRTRLGSLLHYARVGLLA
jgi:hypothetical protein